MKQLGIVLLTVLAVECTAQSMETVVPAAAADSLMAIITSGIPGTTPVHISAAQKAMDALLRPVRPNTITLTSAEVSRMPISSIHDLRSLMPGIYQRRRGEPAVAVGGRPGGDGPPASPYADEYELHLR